jgi:hypothetical protein
LNKRHCTYILLAIAFLIGGGLACAVPTPTTVDQSSTVTPYVPATSPSNATEPPPTEADEGKPTPAEATDAPLPAETEAVEPAETETVEPVETEAVEPTATDTPLPPPPTPEPEPTATPEATVEPLVIVDTGYEIVDWEGLPSKEWEGHIRIKFTGGAPPYTSSIGHREPQEENYHYFRYAACKGASVRADVWSADGQHANRDIWVEAPWCPTPAP